MTAYIHIGTMKTGTSSLQKFLAMNKSVFIKYGYHVPEFGSSGKFKHVYLQHLINSFAKTDLDLSFFLKKFQNDFPVSYNDFERLQSEIAKINHYGYIFSSEGFSILATRKFVESMNTILRFLGFKKIVIVCYIRDTRELCVSLTAQQIKDNIDINFVKFNTSNLASSLSQNTYDSKKIIKNYIDVFGKENLIVRLFDKNEFYQGDLFKDFVHAIGLQWSDNFTISKKKTNESLDLIGIELQRRFNKKGLGGSFYNKKSLIKTVNKYFIFTYLTDKRLKFQPPKEIIQSYIDYFKESNEWVRKEFFPHKESLFPKKDLTDYKENYELKEMKPEYWDKITEFIADIVLTKNQNIADKTIIIQNKDKVIVNQTNQINSLQAVLKDNEIKLIQMQTSNNALSNT
ncbi:hypothetical protein MWJ07_001841, partial [Campylobacter coli]|nr:hypothetical protein [Campylobacter coli]